MSGEHRDYLCVVQITDSHLFAQTDRVLLGINTQNSLEAVLDLVRHEVPQPDLILATGDLSQDGSQTSYQRYQQQLGTLGAPVYSLPGNHDLGQVMADSLYPGWSADKLIDLAGWRIVLLDSHIDHKVGGALADTELRFLEQVLTEAPETPTLVCLHHQPVPMGSAWIDRIGVADSQPFFALLDQHPQVRCVLWGHVHQSFDSHRNRVRLLATPSTCVQFTPQSQDFAVDERQPGYRELRLYADGRLETRVSRLPPGLFKPDLNQGGY